MANVPGQPSCWVCHVHVLTHPRLPDPSIRNIASPEPKVKIPFDMAAISEVMKSPSPMLSTLVCACIYSGVVKYS